MIYLYADFNHFSNLFHQFHIKLNHKGYAVCIRYKLHETFITFFNNHRLWNFDIQSFCDYKFLITFYFLDNLSDLHLFGHWRPWKYSGANVV